MFALHLSLVSPLKSDHLAYLMTVLHLVLQPRLQGTFPWLWRKGAVAPHLQSQGRAPWGRG